MGLIVAVGSKEGGGGAWKFPAGIAIFNGGDLKAWPRQVHEVTCLASGNIYVGALPALETSVLAAFLPPLPRTLFSCGWCVLIPRRLFPRPVRPHLLSRHTNSHLCIAMINVIEIVLLNLFYIYRFNYQTWCRACTDTCSPSRGL